MESVKKCADLRKIFLALLFLFWGFCGVKRATAQTWVQLAPTGPTPSAPSNMNAVYDAAGNAMIVFGGESMPRSSATTVLSNANGLGGMPTWTALSPTGQLPPGRDVHSVVYDSTHDRMIIFGGFSAGQPLLNDTWVLSNASGSAGSPSWAQLSPTGELPPPLAAHTAVYDPASNRMIVFGGCTGSASLCNVGLNDTWVLTNANGLGGTPQWIQLQPSGPLPPGRNSHTAAYDPASNRMIIFGGATNGGGGTILNDTWVLTNANGLGGTPQWIQLMPSTTIPGRFNHTAVYDPGTNRMTVFSGAVDTAHHETNQVWVLTNANGLGGTPAWTQLSPAGGPPLPREDADAVYDPSSNRMTIFSGYNDCSVACNLLVDVWVLTNANGATGSGLAITQVLPGIGGNGGSVTMQLFGNGFVQGDQVTLMQQGGTSLTATNVSFVSANLLTATFDLTQATAGIYDVVVAPPSGSPATLSGGFTVQQGGAPNVYVDIIGRSKIRIGQPTTFYVVVGNSGTADAFGVPLWVQVPNTVGISLASPPGPMSQGSGGISDARSSSTSASLGTGLSFEDPSSYEVTISDNTVIPLMLPVVPSGSSENLPVIISAASTLAFQLQAWVNPPWIRNIITGAAVGNPQAITCMEDMMETAFSVADPVLGVGIALTNLVEAQSWKEQADSAISLNISAAEAAGKSGSAIELLDDADTALGTLYETIPACAAAAQQTSATTTNVTGVQSLDPNDKVGSAGVGPKQYISGAMPLRYSVYFGNEVTATAPAQQVVITDHLDITNDSMGTFALGPLSFGSRSITPPPLQTSFSTTVDLRPTTDLLVAVSGRLNPSTGLLTWSFQSLDPSTGQPPTDPTVGFLPPGGNGSAFFTVMPKNGLDTGTQIDNQASVVFDQNAPITTPTWLNTLDNSPPSSSVSALPATESCSSFQVDWSGTDEGSGIKDFTIFVSDNGAAFAPWLTNTAATSATYAGQPGHNYSFYSIAEDQVGNVEAAKTSAEATTATDATSACGRPSLAGRILSSSFSGTTLTINLQLTDTGAGDARDVQINDFRLRVLTGVGTITYLGALPISAGDVSIGGTTMLTLTFSVPTTITKFVLTEDGSLQDVPGNTYNFSIGQVVFP